MRTKSYHGATKSSHGSESSVWATDALAVSWDDLRVATVCARMTSFRSAARALNTSLPTVIRHIDRLERTLGRKLFVRLRGGIQTTADGRVVLDDLRTMEQATESIVRRARASRKSSLGFVRLAMTDGIGTYWAVPKIVDFNRNSPIKIALTCTNELMDVARLKADISVQLVKPTSAEAIVVKVGSLHTYPFVSTDYARQFGVPKRREDAINHRLIQQVSPMVDPGIYARIFNVDSVDDMVSLRTETSAAVLYAAERGGGIAFLPTYALALGAPLVPIDIGVRNNFTIWLSYHPDFKRSERHRAIIAWVKRIFDQQRYPCFRDEFIHPYKLVTMMKGAVARDSAVGFAAANLGRKAKAPASVR